MALALLLAVAAAVVLWTEPLPPVEDVAVLTPQGDIVRGGYAMDASEAMRLAGVFLRLVGVPLILAVVLPRSGGVRRLEERM